AMPDAEGGALCVAVAAVGVVAVPVSLIDCHASWCHLRPAACQPSTVRFRQAGNQLNSSRFWHRAAAAQGGTLLIHTKAQAASDTLQPTRQPRANRLEIAR